MLLKFSDKDNENINEDIKSILINKMTQTNQKIKTTQMAKIIEQFSKELANSMSYEENFKRFLCSDMNQDQIRESVSDCLLSICFSNIAHQNSQDSKNRQLQKLRKLACEKSTQTQISLIEQVNTLQSSPGSKLSDKKRSNQQNLYKSQNNRPVALME